ncbi:MAG: hypothetical protein D6724_01165, partial [Armatimonadetes bacterium]
MKRAGNPCNDYVERIVLVALGEEDHEAERHAEECQGCREWLEEMKRIMEVARLKRFEPPQELVDQVKGWAERRTVRAEPVRSSLGLAGARRGEADAFQVLLDAAGETVRVAYTREDGSWKVLVEAPAIYGSLRIGGKTVAGSDGRFRFTVRSLK